MKTAIIKTGAKQYKVKEGDKIRIEILKGDYQIGDKIIFDEVVLIDENNKTELGQPALEGKKVEAKLVGEGKGKKIRIQKFKSKSNYHKVQGHRQRYFEVEIVKI